MLNIPETIQALYKADGIRKNVRVQFPHGEYSDLTNNDILIESLHFTESVCSQQVFRFGLAEAKQIEFETVGVGNMYGMTIDCFIEIDTSSLTAAQITAIQADPGDGAIVLSANSDIGFGFYRIALGRFLVTSCPRDHKAMTHRKVTAYDDSGYWLTRMDAFERQKLSRGYSNSSFSFLIRNYLLSKMAAYGTDVLTENNLTATQILGYADGTTSTHEYHDSIAAIDPEQQSGRPPRIWITVYPRTFTVNADAIYGYENADSWDIRETIADWIEDYAEDQGLIIDPPVGLTAREYIEKKVIDTCAPFISWTSTFWGGARVYDASGAIPNNAGAFYPYKGAGTTLLLPETIEIRKGAIYSSSELPVLQTYTRPADAKDLTVSRWDKTDSNITDPLEGVTVKFEATQNDSGSYTYIDAYDPAALINGALELEAQFAMQRRDIDGLGGMKLLRLGSPETSDTVSGDLVEFSTKLPAPVKDLAVSFSPTQDLNGYDKPWPPGGGKNKFAIRNGSATVGGGTVSFSAVGTVSFAGVSPTANSVATMHGSNTEANKMTLPAGSYIVSCEEFGDANCYVGININSTSGAYAATSRGSGAFTVQAGDYVYPRLRVGAGATVDNVTIHPMIRLASVADDTWEPYYNICPIGGYDDVDVFVEDEYDAGATPAETVSLGSTYYSGMLDVTSGVLTANMIGLVFDGTEEEWIWSGTAPKRFFRYVYSGAKSNTYTTRKCSHYPNAVITSSNTDVGYYAYTSTAAPNDVWLNFRPDLDAIPDLTAWKAFLAAQYSAGTPVQAIFQIDTPLTVQLTPTEVETLVGQNVMWGSAGPIKVSFIKEIDSNQIVDLWWDEYDVEPIGSVLYSYKNSIGQMQDAVLELENGGGSIYDMTQNAVLCSAVDMSVSDIEDLINAAFVPNVQNSAFIPIDLTMQGWPWIEASDCLAIETEDGILVQSYALTREMDGIQKLTDVISASSGEIINEGK